LSTHQWSGKDGWGFARIELTADRNIKLTIRDSQSPKPNPLIYSSVRSTLEMDLPDGRFVNALNAQVAHLMMGLLDCRTPPGETTNYPLAWQRDGSAVVAGLVRAGQLDVAKQLARYFAETDFFGGFGAEGDAPGQGLRVMEDVAVRLNDPAFDQWLWHHAKRKVEWILKMSATDKQMRAPYIGPIVPAHRDRDDLDLVCDPNQGGCIVGRMDFCRPISYITGISMLGLRGAAALARRLKHDEEAKEYQAAAERLQKAWLDGPDWPQERTYISGMWPTWAAAPVQAAYREHLLEKPDPKAYMPWTYFGAAVTHQWLFLGDPNRVWKNLEWFFEEQTSPGLYTWLEGAGEENSFHLWQGVRGWTNPPYVTPHYWTAGEMLALQVDMLAYVDQSTSEPALVIGGGVPASWLAKPMSVRGLPTSLGQISWKWKDNVMTVAFHDEPAKVCLGAAFPADTAVRTQQIDQF
jgi:hypothetical protein